MEPVAAILGSWAIGKVADTLWTAAGSQVQDWLKKTDIERAIKAAEQAVQRWERELPPQEHLFFSCEQKQAYQFLDRAFTATSVQEELLRPLQHEGQPDLPLLLDAFAQIADEMQVKLNRPYLKPWLKQFTDAYFAQTSAFRRYQLAKQRYLEQLQTLCDDVKLLGVAVEGREEEKQKALVQIFVMPNVEEIRSGGPLEAFWAEEQAERQLGLLQEQRQWALREHSKQRFSAKQLLGQTAKRVVILGAPGSGKTTLINYFVVKLAAGKATELQMPEADWLPILIRIRDWVEHPDRSLLDHAYGFCDRLAVGKLPEGFFEYWLSSGQAVILLDGLDEVADETRRSHIAEEIELFLQRYSHNPALITSRPAGYRSYFRSETFPHYELQPFDERQIEEFINNWYDSRTVDRQEAEQGKASLRRALKDSPRIKLLAQNPLLLTIVALIHRYEAYLPKQRHELYERAVKTLLTSWERGKYSSGEVNTWDLQYLKHDDLLLIMRQLAYWVHTQGSTGDSEGGTLIDKDELMRQLSRLIKTQKQIELHYAQQEAERLISFIRSRTGLLNEQGRDCYAFVHKTFQEYLTAEEIHYQHECEDDFEIVLAHIEEHLHAPHWHEVLLLLVSRQVGKRAARAIRQVLTQGSDYEQWLHRDLLFAADCLAENCKNLKTVDSFLVTEILDRLVELEIGDEKRVGEKARAEIQRIFCRFRDTEFQSQVLSLLKEQVSIARTDRLRQYRVVLGEKEALIVNLSELLQKTPIRIENNVAQALFEIANTSEISLDGLLRLLQSEDIELRLKVFEVLCNLNNLSERRFQNLQFLLRHQSAKARAEASRIIGLTNKLEEIPETVLEEVEKLLKDNNKNVRSYAALTLGKLGKNSQAVFENLIAWLTCIFDQEGADAAELLGKAARNLDWLEQKLFSLLGETDIDIRCGAVYALGYLLENSHIVSQKLLPLLKDESTEVQIATIHALRQLECTSELEKSLMILLESESHHEYYFFEDYFFVYVIVTLIDLGNISGSIIERLLDFSRDENFRVRFTAVQGLSKLVDPSDRVVCRFLELLQDPIHSVRSETISALGKLGKTSDRVTSAVVQWIEQNQDSEFVGSGIDALWAIVQE